MANLSPILGAAGSALLRRTYLLETNTPSGIPRILIVFDAVTSENPEFNADITEHPVEDGPEVSDHIQLKNPILSIHGTVSGSPIDLATTIGNLVAGGQSMITSSQFRANVLNSGLQQIAGVAGSKLLGNASQSSAGALTSGAADAIARSALLDAYERKARFTVVTRRYRYENMAIQSLSFPRDSDTGLQTVFEIEMKRLRIVKSTQVIINNLDEAVINQAQPVVGNGNQSAAGVSSKTSAALEAKFPGT